jgi:hypothetical protein
VQWDIIWRTTAGDDTVLATFTHHFDPIPGNFDAQPFEAAAQAPAAPASPGDRLVLRYQAMNATVNMAYIPNGDGALTNGRIPSIILP